MTTNEPSNLSTKGSYPPPEPLESDLIFPPSLAEAGEPCDVNPNNEDSQNEHNENSVLVLEEDLLFGLQNDVLTGLKEDALSDPAHCHCQCNVKDGGVLGASCTLKVLEQQWTFRIIPNDIQKFSGDCLFMAIAQFLRPEVDPSASLQIHSIIRETIVNYVIRDEPTWRRYSIWLKNNHQARIKEFRNYPPESSCRVLHSKIQKAYKKSMLTAGYFGTMAELSAAMDLFGFRTTLIQEDQTDRIFSVYNIGDSCWDHHMYLLFTGHSDGGHFQMLDLISEQEDISMGKFQVTASSQENATITICPFNNWSSHESQRPVVGPVSYKRKKPDESESAEDVSKRGKNQKDCEMTVNSNDEIGLTKLETCQLRSVLTDDYDAAGCEGNEANKAECATSDALTLSINESSTSGIKDTSFYYIYLPPWCGTSLHKALENTLAEVQGKCFALLDCRDTKCKSKILSLKKNQFIIESEDLYKIKNITDKGIFLKLQNL